MKAETSTGPVWHRYNEDGYGEHQDGTPFDGTGIGRGWPLLAGERGHYELALGNVEGAMRLLRVMEAQSSPGGLIPEQVWDSPDIPEKELFNGRPAGSAMPLVWAHAEYVKLLRSLRDGAVFDMPPQTRQRYLIDRVESAIRIWRFYLKCRSIPPGRVLRVEVRYPSFIHWSTDGWNTIHDTPLEPSTLGIYYSDLPVGDLNVGSRIDFTFFDTRESKWEGIDYSVSIEQHGRRIASFESILTIQTGSRLPMGDFKFSDATNPNQALLLHEPSTAQLVDGLRTKFRGVVQFPL